MIARRFILILFLLVSFSQADVLSDLEHYIKLRTQAATEPVKITSKCGFKEAIELQLYYSQLPAALQKMAKPLLQMPKRQYQVKSPSGHFTLHYDLTGIHAVPPKDSLSNGIPDYIDSAGVILDHVWNVEINQLGFRPPPDSTGNPVKSYPVFFSSMGYYGLTNFDVNEDIPSLPGTNFVSYIELHNNFAGSQFATNGLEALKVTAAHEFHHAIQLGYQFRWEFKNNSYETPDRFFMEMSSTFMEDYVYDKVNDYVQYVNRFLPIADSKSFNAMDNNTEYANSIYLHMLTKRYGIGIFRKIWENIVRYPAIAALDVTLRTYNSSFSQSFSRYACWLYFSGNHADTLNYFKDGKLFTNLKVSHDREKLNENLDGLYMRHVRILIDKTGVYRAKVSCQLNFGRLNHIINTQKIKNPIAFNKAQYFTQFKKYPLIVVLTDARKDTLKGLSYHLDLSPAMVKQNPVMLNQEADQVQFVNVPQKAKIRIYNILGQLIKTLNSGNSTSVFWNLRNRFNQYVASGEYFYLITGSDFRSNGKMIILR